LRIQTYGGIGNQRECIVNGVLLARLLGLGLVLPRVQLIAHKEQDCLGSKVSYKSPFDNRSKWGAFDLMFDRNRFIEGCSSVGVRVIEEPPSGVLRPWVFTCSHPCVVASRSRRGHVALSADALSIKIPRLPPLSKLNLHGCAPWGGGNSMAPSFELPPTADLGLTRVYDVPANSICYNFAITRGETNECTAFGSGGACHRVMASLVHSATVRNLVEDAVKRIFRRWITTQPPVHWHAVHMNTFRCRATVTKFRSHVLSVLHKRIVGELNRSADDGVYFMTQLHGEEFERASRDVFPNAVWKTDVLPNMTSEYPFEVAAQVDFEIGFALTSRTSGEYFGEFATKTGNYSGPRYASSSDENLRPRLISAGVGVHTIRPHAACG
jgi:hypothetical protein